ALGAAGNTVESLRKQAAALESRHAAPKTDESTRIATALDALPKDRAAFLWGHASAAWKDLSEADRDAFVDAVLALDAAHAEANAYVASLVPEALRARIPSLEWRGWKKVLGAGTTMRFPPNERTPEKGLDEIGKELGRA